MLWSLISRVLPMLLTLVLGAVEGQDGVPRDTSQIQITHEAPLIVLRADKKSGAATRKENGEQSKGEQKESKIKRKNPRKERKEEDKDKESWGVHRTQD